MNEDSQMESRGQGRAIGLPKRMSPIERLPLQIQEAEDRLARLKRLQELLDKNKDLQEALDIVFSGNIL